MTKDKEKRDRDLNSLSSSASRRKRRCGAVRWGGSAGQAGGAGDQGVEGAEGLETARFLSVSLRLAMPGRLLRRSGLPAKLKHYHEAATLVTPRTDRRARRRAAARRLPATRPRRLTEPFALGYRPVWTRRGVIGGWLALIVAASFYVRRWIGTRTWRWLHRWTLGVYLLALAHVMGAGTDGRSPWMLALLTVLVAPNVFALAYRMLPAAPRTRQGRPPSPPVSPSRTNAPAGAR